MQPLGLSPRASHAGDERAEAVQAGGWVSPGDGWHLPGDCSADGAAEVMKGPGEGGSRVLVIVRLRVVPSHGGRFRLAAGGFHGRRLNS